MFGLLQGMLLMAADAPATSGLPTWAIPTAVTVAVLVLPFVAGSMLAQAFRMPDYATKIGLILLAIAGSAAVIYFKWPPPRGVDLKGGVILVYEVDEAQTAAIAGIDSKGAGGPGKVNMEALCQALKMRVNPDGLKEIVIRPFGEKQVEIIVPETDQAEIDYIKKKLGQAGFLEFMIVANSPDKDAALISAAQAQRDSADKKKNREVYDKPGGTQIGFWARIARTPEGEPGALRAMKAREAVFDIARDGNTGEWLTDAQRGEMQRLYRLKGKELEAYLREKNIELEVLMRRDELDQRVQGTHLFQPAKRIGATGGWEIHFSLQREGPGLMAALTGSNLPNPERKLGIVLDGELISAPVIRGRIADNGQITGQFTEAEVDFVVEILRAGSLPAVLSKAPVSENLIGSILGEDTVYKGTMATVLSFVLVALFMLIYYRFAGVVANVALLLNVALTLAIMMLIKAPLTLPGLAGLVLTCGMAVDANVLIYERIREELAKGAGLRMAIRNGFERAMVTIIDSNLTTLLTAVVLYAIGTDQVRGFATTLTFGLLTSMFTACYVARVIFDIAERNRWITSLSMMKMMTTTNIKFTEWFKPAVAASVIFMAIGIYAAWQRGRTLFDIDLVGGTSVVPVFKQSVPDAEVRLILDQAFAGQKDIYNSSVAYSVTPMTVQGQLPNTYYKIDSSWRDGEDAEKLAKLVAEKFGGQGGKLQTYDMEVVSVKTITTSKVDETPAQPQPPTGDGKQPETTEDKKAAPADSSTDKNKNAPTDEPSKDTKEGDSSKDDKKPACADGEEEENKAKKAETETAKDGAKEPAAGDTLKTETPSDPQKADGGGKADPNAAPQVPADVAKPVPGQISTVVSEAVLKFPAQSKISAEALTLRLKDSAQRLYNETPQLTPANPQWDGRSSEQFDTWTVTMSLNEEKSKKVLDDVVDTMRKTPVFQSTSTIGGQVALDTTWRAIAAVLISLVGIAAYIWIRFHKISWGIAAVAALVHDTLVMLGCVAASVWFVSALGFIGIEEFKISLTVIAAFLTLIGFSINDTIVIFDRIREVRGKDPDLTAKMIDDSVNQTLSRTILTSGTVFIVLMVLYFGGGPGIHAFAFSMLVGVISGTYSTVFIASPLLLWMMQRDNKKGGMLSA